VIIAMITGGFVARYQRETSAAGEDHISQGMEQLALEIKELRAEVKQLRADVQDLGPIGQR
jgi:outer membrane murein-binding lipoprotein Lpp